MSDEHSAIPVKCEARPDGVALLIIDNPPVNALSTAVRSGLLEQMRILENSAQITAIVVMGARGTFVAGADIHEMDGPLLDPDLLSVLSAIEQSSKPVVAAIANVAFGGGAELAMACHARVAADDAKFGLPEVKLGIIPGAAGIPSLLRLVDALSALDIVASGKPISAKEALELGAIDAAVPSEELLDHAAQMAKTLMATGFNKISDRTIRAFDEASFETKARHWQSRAKGHAAVGEAVEAVRACITADFRAGAEITRTAFLRLRDSDQAQALRYQFFAERRAHRVATAPSQVTRTASSVAVVGAGTMGRGIAGACLRADLSTVLIDVNTDVLAAAPRTIMQSLLRSARSAGWSAEELQRKFSLLRTTSELSEIAGVDVVIEAVFEDEVVKHNVLQSIEVLADRNALLATNTSYLDFERLTSGLQDPARLIGLHFFAPAEIMRLVEVIRPSDAPAELIARGSQFARSLGKLPVISGVCDGFIVNRILTAYRSAMDGLLLHGALPHVIDEVLEEFGMAMGPFATADLSGLDIGWSRRKRLAHVDPAMASHSIIADRLCETGRFGRKTGRGWYDYSDGRHVDPFVTSLIEDVSAEFGISRRNIESHEIVTLAMAAMVAEACRIVEEGIAQRGSDIDLAVVTGLGFPAWRGGPLYFADRHGLMSLREDLLLYREHSLQEWPTSFKMCLASGARLSDLVAPEDA